MQRARAWLLVVAMPVAIVMPALAASPQPSTIDCDHVTAHGVREVLSPKRAPRIIALQGSVAFVTMEPFAEFLEAMGYPSERLGSGPDRARTRSSFIDSIRLVGEIAWYYERDGVMPVLVGHSQGGMLVIKALHELAGTNGRRELRVWNVLRNEPEPRTTIVDPVSDEMRSVADLKVRFAAVLATGSLPRVLLGQWGMLPLLREVPDSVVDLIAFSIPWDGIAGTFANPPPYRATGSAHVRNVVLPSSYSHIDLPRMAHLAGDPATREWIEAFDPSVVTTPPAGVDVTNLVHAAELWHALKHAWCASTVSR